jgi:hypothetical protein
MIILVILFEEDCSHNVFDNIWKKPELWKIEKHGNWKNWNSIFLVLSWNLLKIHPWKLIWNQIKLNRHKRRWKAISIKIILFCPRASKPN